MVDLQDTYDYIVIGAGSAGCVVAARLSENQHDTVLLLEAGPSDEEWPAIYVPAQVATLQRTKIDWDYETLPLKHAAQGFHREVMHYPRGKVLGGSSCLNYMAYVRGHSADYDSWESLGCDGWGWKDVLPYFMKSENNTCLKHTDTRYHNVGGPLSVSNNAGGNRSEFSKEFIKAGVELGYEEVDINSGNNIGFGDSPSTIHNGQRCSTANTFLHPASNRTNLTIQTDAYVNKLIMEGNKVIGVEFTTGGATKSIRVNREVAVCAGAINSPQILMLSGIGPRSHLESLGIECVADLPVGKNLQDHLAMQLKATANADSGALSLNDIVDPKNAEQYKLNGTGILAGNGLESVAFIKTGVEMDIDWPDLQIATMPLYYGLGPEEPEILGIKSKDLYPIMGYVETDHVMSQVGVILLSILLHPKSVGEIRLASKDPTAPPIIDPRCLEHPDDVKVIAEGLRFSKRIADTGRMKRLGVKLHNIKMPDSITRGDTYSDANLEQYIRYFANTLYHHVGTCKMGAADDNTAVVDPQLRVRGIEGLRVIDASIMPHVTSGNTNAPCIMIGEKGADLMKASRDVGKTKGQMSNM